MPTGAVWHLMQYSMISCFNVLSTVLVSNVGSMLSTVRSISNCVVFVSSLRGN